jgi:hypothetical protein
VTAESWLAGLREGRSFITNGPLLELETERAEIGDTLTVDSPNHVTVVGRGMGRVDFGGLELIYNGKVVHRVKTEAEDGYYYADMRHSLYVENPGWFALRILQGSAVSELGGPLFAHTSPIYVQVGGRTIFDVKTARGIIEEMQASMDAIREQAVFANDSEREQVLDVYRRGIQALEEQIRTQGR